MLAPESSAAPTSVVVEATLLAVLFVIWVLGFKASRRLSRGLGPSPDFSDVSWPPSFVAGLGVLYVAMNLFVPLVGGVVLDLKPTRASLVTIQAIANVLACAIGYFVLRMSFGSTPADVGVRFATPGVVSGYAVTSYVAYLPLVLLSVGVTSGIYSLLGKEPPIQSVLQIFEDTRGKASLAWLVLLGAIVIPITEEFLFRGILYSVLRRRLGRFAGVALSSAIFALLHDVVTWLPVFVLGVLLAIVYDRTRSLLASGLVHVVHNGSQLAILLLFGPKG